MIYPESFYQRSVLSVARDLLGSCLARRSGAGPAALWRIVETEAYQGPLDLASHASRGRTARNAPMFGPPGRLYVYLVYGLHHMLNIVTGPSGWPAAVLIRALEPVSKTDQTSEKFPSGPAKLTKVLRVDRSDNNLPVFDANGLMVIRSGARRSGEKIIRAPRVGVDYAGPYKDKLWRYYLAGNPYVSKY